MRPEHRAPLVASLAVVLACAGVLVHAARTDALGGLPWRLPMSVVAGELVRPAQAAEPRAVASPSTPEPTRSSVAPGRSTPERAPRPTHRPTHRPTPLSHGGPPAHPHPPPTPTPAPVATVVPAAVPAPPADGHRHPRHPGPHRDQHQHRDHSEHRGHGEHRGHEDAARPGHGPGVGSGHEPGHGPGRHGHGHGSHPGRP